jgi:hypothetical protein
MKRLSLPLLLSLSALFTLNPSLNRAEALPFLDIGPKVGFGVGLDSKMSTNSDIIAGGLAASFDLVMIQLEVNMLYINTTPVGSSASYNTLGLPIIGRFDISPVPMFKLALGGGYERRFSFGDDAEGAEQNYIPLSVRSDLSIPLVGAVGVEGRFNVALGENSGNELMLYLHAFL